MFRFFLRVIVITFIIGLVWWWYATPEMNRTVSDADATVIMQGEEETLLAEVDFDGAYGAQEVYMEVRDDVQKSGVDDASITGGTTESHSEIPQKIQHDVPFVVQAPQAQWEDVRFQDACEEASLLMAYQWATDAENLSKAKATEALEAMFAREATFFTPETIDTSIADTARFGMAYFSLMMDVQEGISLDDIYHALAAGHIVIVPTNGKKLDNPHFTNGGPERHMLLIVGYDKKKNLFITNDPGTRKGEGYRYDASLLYNAIRDYPTGHKVPIAVFNKTMIVARK